MHYLMHVCLAVSVCCLLACCHDVHMQWGSAECCLTALSHVYANSMCRHQLPWLTDLFGAGLHSSASCSCQWVIGCCKNAESCGW